MVFIFYALCVVFMLLVRPWLAQHFLPKHGRMSVYAALYFFPTLALIHAVFGGLICEYNLLNLILHIHEYRTTPSNSKTAVHKLKSYGKNRVG
jgi:hypothetical protein